MIKSESCYTVEPRYNEVLLAKFVRYNEVSFRSLYRGLRYTEVRYIEVPLHYVTHQI